MSRSTTASRHCAGSSARARSRTCSNSRDKLCASGPSSGESGSATIGSSPSGSASARGSARRERCRCASLNAIRYSHVENCARSSNRASPRHARRNTSCATSSASSWPSPNRRNAAYTRSAWSMTSSANASSSPKRALWISSCSEGGAALTARLYRLSRRAPRAGDARCGPG